MPDLSNDLIEELAERFKALSEPSRLAILRFLMEQAAPVGVIADAVGQSQPNTSRHLAALRRAGFVSGQRSGQSITYAIADPVVIKLCDLMCKSPLPRRTG